MPEFSHTEFPKSYSVLKQIEYENRFPPEVFKTFIDHYLKEGCTDTILSTALCGTFIKRHNYIFRCKDFQDKIEVFDHVRRYPVVVTDELIIVEP